MVLATGVAPRMPDIPGIDHPMVLSYAEAITGKPVGKTVAVVGAGGIGFDVSEFLVTTPTEPADEYRSPSVILKEWKAEWGVADPQETRGALTTPIPAPAAREVYLLQRTKGPQGKGLGQDVGLGAPRLAEGQGCAAALGRELRTHRRRRPAHQLRIRSVEPAGARGRQRGDLRRPGVGARARGGLRARGIEPHVIGGAAVAAELDAKRAIKQGTELAARL